MNLRKKIERTLIRKGFKKSYPEVGTMYHRLFTKGDLLVGIRKDAFWVEKRYQKKVENLFCIDKGSWRESLSNIEWLLVWKYVRDLKEEERS